MNSTANTYTPGAQTITVDGRLTNLAGDAGLIDPSVVIDVKIYNPQATCILYEEKQTVDTSQTDGRFTILVGSLTGSPKRVSGIGADPGNPMITVFQNNVAIAGSCGAYSPAVGESRLLRVTVAPSTTGTIEVLAPDSTIDQVPNAMVAETLQGLDRDHVLAIDSTTTLSQANVANIFSAGNYPLLTALLSGSSSQYVTSTSSGGAKIPSVSTVPTMPSAGQIWFNSSANSFQYYNGSSVQTLGNSGTGLTSVTVGPGLTANGAAGGTLNAPGTIDLVNSVAANTYTKVSVSTKGIVTYGTALAESDLPVIQTPGKVLGDAITSGTIGGGTTFYSSGNVTTSGYVKAGTVSSGVDTTRQIQLFDPAPGSTYAITLSAPTLTAGYSVVFPAVQGAAGTTLMNDGSGHLSWTAGSAGAVNSVGLALPSIFTVTNPVVTSTGTLTATLANENQNLIFAGPASGGAGTPSFRGLAVADLPAGYDGSIQKNALSSGKIWVGSTAGIATPVTPFGDILLAISGSATVSQIQGLPVTAGVPSSPGQVLRWDGGAWTPNFVAMTDLRSKITGATSFATSCDYTQTLTFSSVTDSLACSKIQIASPQITWGSTGANLVFAGPSTGGSAAPTFRSLTAADLPGGYTSQWITNASNIYYGSGNVGIGTSVPQSPLHVYSSVGSGSLVTITDASAASSAIGLAITNSGSGTTQFQMTNYHTGTNYSPTIIGQRAQGTLAAPTASQSGDRLFALVSEGYTGAAFGGAAGGILFNAAENFTSLAQGTNISLETTAIGTTNRVARVLIQASGNVGVGTTSPQAILDLYATGAASALIVPRDTFGNRPAGINGMIRYNTSSNVLETFSSGGWAGIATSTGGGGSYLPLAGGTLSGTVAHPLGSVSAPAINFGDVTSGFYSSGAGNVSLATYGTARISVLPSGNVGIGTTNPGTNFEVNGSAIVDYDLTLGSNGGTSSSLNIWTASNSFYVGNSNGYPKVNGGYFQFTAGGSNPVSFYQTPMTFGGSSLAKSTVDVAGNLSVGSYANTNAAPTNGLIVSGSVGIGTPLPGATLDVNGGVRAGSSTVVTAACTGTNEGTQRYNYTSHTMEFCNGTAWTSVSFQNTGTTVPVTAQAPPVSASTYAITTATANYTPSFGSIANTYDGTWIAPGTYSPGNGSCVGFPGDASQYIVYDLGSNHVINNIYFSSEDGGSDVLLNASFSTDNITFISSVSLTPSGPDDAHVSFTTATLSAPQTARYIRIMNGTGGNSPYQSFCDIAFGP